MSKEKKFYELGVPNGEVEETPDAKPYDDTGINIPQGTEIDASVYNDAFDRLQQTFKEGAEVISMLRNMTPVDNVSSMAREEEFLENVAFNAIFEYYDSGVFYEAIDKENKEEAKKVIKKIRSKMSKTGIDEKYGLRQFWSTPERAALEIVKSTPALMNVAAIAGFSGIIASIIGTITGTLIAIPLNRWVIKLFRSDKSFTAKWWQMIGGFNVSDDASAEELKKILEELREDYKKELGDFTFNLIRIVIPTKVLRLIVTGTSKGYILVVDEKEKATEVIELEPSKKDFEELEEMLAEENVVKKDKSKK